MLETQDRKLFLEALKAPVGYEIDWVIGTSYSLDLLAFLTIPLSYTLQDWQDQEGRPQMDPMKLLEAVRRHAKRLTLFCQTGQIQVPRKYRNALAYIEQSIVEVQPPDKDGVFHPKVWVCRYSAEGQPVHYKLLVQSRNLTFDKSWDVMLVLDGMLESRKNAYTLNHPLGNFIQSFPELAVREVTQDIWARIEQAQYEIRRVAFQPPKPFQSLRFWPLGINGHRQWPFADRMDRTLVISPFLSGPFLKKLARKGNNHLLVSREDSLAQIEKTELDKYKAVYVLQDTSVPEPIDVDEPVSDTTHIEPEVDLPEPLHDGLHAKVYVADAGWDAHMWIGSANATTNAFERNVEFLVELLGKKSACGIDAIMGNPDHKTSFYRLLREFSSDNGDLAEIDMDQRQAEKQLEQIRRLLAAAPFQVTIQVDEKEKDHYLLVLECPKIENLNLSSITLRCWPLSLNETYTAMNISTLDSAQSISFGPVDDVQITSFIAFEARIKEREEKIRFLCNFPLLGAPEDREDRVLRSIIRNRDDFLRYLLMLLSGDPESATLDAAIEALNGRTTTNDGLFQPIFPLMEVLIRTLQRHPEQLDTIANLVDSLKKSEEGMAILPEGFLELWEPIWAIREVAAT